MKTEIDIIVIKLLFHKPKILTKSISPWLEEIWYIIIKQQKEQLLEINFEIWPQKIIFSYFFIKMSKFTGEK